MAAKAEQREAICVLAYIAKDSFVTCGSPFLTNKMRRGDVSEFEIGTIVDFVFLYTYATIG